ncbi:MAG: hypothetical protein M1813_005372 [Trichoglossum hirsutum]|nr:MAG: hypothetical protein M1813_005372 [Trichoglossum hirsutum]
MALMQEVNAEHRLTSTAPILSPFRAFTSTIRVPDSPLSPDDGDDRSQSPVPLLASPVRPSTFQIFDLSSSAPGDEDDRNVLSSPPDDGDDKMQSPIPFLASPVRPSTFQVFDLSSSAPGDEDDRNVLSSPPDDGDDRMQSPVPFHASPVRPSTFQVFDLSSFPKVNVAHASVVFGILTTVTGTMSLAIAFAIWLHGRRNK